jgi:hypothetical protein
MKKEKAIEYHEKKIEYETRIRDMLKTLPVDVPVEFIYEGPKWPRKPDPSYPIVGYIRIINLESYQIELISTDGTDGYIPQPESNIKWGTRSKKENTMAVKFNRILSYRVLPEDELPVCLGHKRVYPKLHELITKGKAA